MRNFWNKLHKPFFALAPMHDVTDAAFRQVVCACKKPDVLYTEFVSIDGLTHEKSREKIIRFYLQFSKTERPIVAQIWGSDPHKFKEAAHIIEKLGFDGIDINMGCPDKKVVASKGGAAHVQNQENAIACIQSVLDTTKLPVSVKTRLGFDTVDLGWIEKLLYSNISALAIHLRTKKELSKVSAHWELGEIIQKLRGKNEVLLIGNGDVQNISDARQKAEKYSFDGIMLGRGVLGNPWTFSEEGKPKELKKRLEMLKLHAELFQKYFEGIKSFAMLKKHVRGYVGSFSGAKRVRQNLMDTKTINQFIEELGVEVITN